MAHEAVHALIKIISREAWIGKLVLSLNDLSAPSLSPGMATEPLAFCSPSSEVDGAAGVIQDLGEGSVILFYSFAEPNPSRSKQMEGLPMASHWLCLSAHAALRGAGRDG